MSEPEGEDRSEEQVLKEESATYEEQMTVDPHDDRTLEFERVGLSRMRTSWSDEDAEALNGIHAVVDREIMMHFAAAFQVMNEIYEIVREPSVDTTTGEIRKDQYGWTIWLRNESGAYIEDYSRLSHKDIEHFLFRITTRLFDWEQQAARLWGNSMYARSNWEQAQARGYQAAREAGGRTVEDRTQASRIAAYEDRLFGIFQTMISRKADAVVRSMVLLSQRLKDVLSA